MKEVDSYPQRIRLNEVQDHYSDEDLAYMNKHFCPDDVMFMVSCGLKMYRVERIVRNRESLRKYGHLDEEIGNLGYGTYGPIKGFKF